MQSNRFGSLMRAARKEAGFSLVYVAGKIGSHKGYVSGIENGKVNPPSPRFLKKLAKLYGMDAQRLMFIAHMQKAPKEIAGDLKRLFEEVGV